jgi:hypothetical protein
VELIGISDAADIIGIDRITLWKRIRDKKVRPTLTVGTGPRKRHFLDRGLVEQLAKEQKAKKTRSDVKAARQRLA